MKKNLLISVWFTLVTTLMFGLIYPLGITGLAQVLFHDRANGQLVQQNGRVVGSRIIGQAFTGPGYFHSRPSAAGTGYDATASSGSNLAPTNRALLDRVKSDVQKLQAENPNSAVPIDLVTASGSGLDPEISPAAAPPGNGSLQTSVQDLPWPLILQIQKYGMRPAVYELSSESVRDCGRFPEGKTSS